MNNELEKFVDMAFKRELYQVVSIDAPRSNRIHDKAMKLIAKMDAENRRGELKELFRHPDPFVRLAAACWVLEVDEDAAMAVLRKLAKIKRGDVGFDAKFKIVCWYEQAHGISLDISKIGEEDF